MYKQFIKIATKLIDLPDWFQSYVKISPYIIKALVKHLLDPGTDAEYLSNAYERLMKRYGVSTCNEYIIEPSSKIGRYVHKLIAEHPNCPDWIKQEYFGDVRASGESINTRRHLYPHTLPLSQKVSIASSSKNTRLLMELTRGAVADKSGILAASLIDNVYNSSEALTLLYEEFVNKNSSLRRLTDKEYLLGMLAKNPNCPDWIKLEYFGCANDRSKK